MRVSSPARMEKTFGGCEIESTTWWLAQSLLRRHMSKESVRGLYVLDSKACVRGRMEEAWTIDHCLSKPATLEKLCQMTKLPEIPLASMGNVGHCWGLK